MMLDFYCPNIADSEANSVSSSADVECYFFFIKSILEIEEACELFLRQHLESISAAVKRGYASIDRERLRLLYDAVDASHQEPRTLNKSSAQPLNNRTDLDKRKPRKTKGTKRSTRSMVLKARKSAISDTGLLIKNSSVFDSVLEVFLHGDLNYSMGRNFMDKTLGMTGNFYLQTLTKLYLETSSPDFEERRERILRAGDRID
ncbi:hypothetical protein QAD02_007521 [Eretmocerus hayati]|uniref:Uncharacterized protein n=1 Tax=Eretmocerus hayati TaxID=131215 RepID=A0ACC2N3T2_9HYME|nr:hypothetical protein QAD02_007521 [Eretmocerus hayati]